MGYFISRDSDRQHALEDPEEELEAELSQPWPGRRSGVPPIDHRRIREMLRTASAQVGAPLPGAVAQRLGQSLGVDLSGVRVHVGSAPAAAARTIGARAYTVGQDIYFGEGHYDPTSQSGERLLAHEVAHTVQQRGVTPDLQGDLEVSQPGDHLEGQADRFASGYQSGRAEAIEPVSVGVVARSSIQLEALQGLDAAWFGVTAPAIAPAGQITQKRSEYMVTLQSPPISGNFVVKMNIPDGKTLEDPKIKVGMVQTMTSMSRTAVYRLGATGPEVTQTKDRGMTRDATEKAYEPGATAAHYAPEPPFYQPTQEIGAAGNVSLAFEDQPKFPALTQLDGGEKLIATRGSDNFNTSVGAKRDGAIVTMSPFGWSVNWDTQFDGETLKTDPKKNAIAIDRMVKEGIYVNSEDYVNKLERETFDSIDAAMNIPTYAMLPLLLKIRGRGDSASAGFLEQAMDRKNPNMVVELKLIKSPNFWPGDDTINTWAQGSKQSSRTVGLSEGASTKVKYKWTEVFAAASVTGGSTLTVWAGVKGHLGGSVEIPFPFTSGGGIITESDIKVTYSFEA